MADYGGLAEEIAGAYEERKAEASRLTASFKPEDREGAEEVSRLIASFKAEMTEMQASWRNVVARVQAGKGAVMAPPPPPPVEEVVRAVAPPPVEEVVGDDLTIIRGIGPGMQSRLNAAGIYTFAQLAGSTPEELRQVLGEAARLANVEAWIEQARELAGMS